MRVYNILTMTAEHEPACPPEVSLARRLRCEAGLLIHQVFKLCLYNPIIFIQTLFGKDGFVTDSHKGIIRGRVFGDTLITNQGQMIIPNEGGPQIVVYP